MIINKNEIEKYFKSSKSKFKDYIKDNKEIKYEYTKNILNISNNKFNLKTEYNIIGYYNPIDSIFIWGWANPFVEKDVTVNIKDSIKESISKKKIDKDYTELFLYFVNNATFYIKEENLDMLLKLVLYVDKGQWLVGVKNEDKSPLLIEFVLIKNIIQVK